MDLVYRQSIETWANRLLYGAVLLLFFSTYNNRAIGAKYIGYSLVLICGLILLWLNPEQVRSKLRDRTLVWLAALAAVSGIAILQVDPEYKLQSFEHFRKGLIQAGLFAVAIPLVIDGVDRLKQAGLALGLASLCITLYCFWEIKSSSIASPLLNSPTSYRYYGFRFILYFPFLWLLTQQTHHWKRFTWITLIAVQLALIAFSGFRGGWLASVVMILLWTFLFRAKKLTLFFAAMLVIALSVAAFSSDYIFSKLNQTDTGKRWDGAWRASLDMILDQPLLGHGFGPSVFKRENDQLAEKNPDWVLGKELTGPHSIYLDATFSAGFPALFVLLAVFGSIIRRLWGVIKITQHGETRSFAVATICCLLDFTSSLVLWKRCAGKC